MPSKNATKVTIGKESTAGTSVAPTAVIPIKATPKLDRKPQKVVDPVIVGAGMEAGESVTSASVKGGMSLSPRACAGYGQILKGALGAEALVSNIIGIVRMKYIGASASCKLVLAGTTITSKVGALGSEVNDPGAAAAGFGTSGVYTVVPGTTTLTALVAAINGFTNYNSTLLSGSGASTIQSINVVAGGIQAKGKWAILLLIGSATGVYAHQFTPDLAIANERPAFSVQSELGVDNLRYAGCSVNSLTLSAALKGLVESEVDLLGFTEAIGQGAMTGLSLPDAKPFMFGQGVTSIGGVDYNFVRSMSAKAENNLKDDGYGQSSVDRAYHAKGMFRFSGDLKLRLDSTSYLERAKVEAGTVASELFIFYGAEGKCVGVSSVREMLIIEVAYSEHSSFDFDENGDVVDCSLTWKAYAPGGSYNYDPSVTVTLISADTTAY